MTTANQLKGAKNRAAGAAFEAVVDASCEAYLIRGEAKVEKTPEPMRIIRPLGNGQYIACFTSTAQPDYKGKIADGPMVVFDAKYTSQDRIEQKVVSAAQVEALEEYAKMGAVCFVLVGFATGNTYRVPWGVWQGMKAMYGRKYLTEADMPQFKVPSDLKVWFLHGMGGCR